jgi:hypothetical protein
VGSHCTTSLELPLHWVTAWAGAVNAHLCRQLARRPGPAPRRARTRALCSTQQAGTQRLVHSPKYARGEIGGNPVVQIIVNRSGMRSAVPDSAHVIASRRLSNIEECSRVRNDSATARVPVYHPGLAAGVQAGLCPCRCMPTATRLLVSVCGLRGPFYKRSSGLNPVVTQLNAGGVTVTKAWCTVCGESQPSDSGASLASRSCQGRATTRICRVAVRPFKDPWSGVRRHGTGPAVTYGLTCRASSPCGGHALR